VKISAKAEYAVLAIVSLARRRESARPVQGHVIAEDHGIPTPYLSRILLDLQRAGLVKSARGATAGT